MHISALNWFGWSLLWLLPLLVRFIAGLLGKGTGTGGRGTIRLWLGSLLMLAASSVLESMLRGGTGNAFGRWLAAGLACLTVALAAVGWWRFHSNAPIPIAVLPLQNLSENSANDYFADGLTGEIIRNLSLIEGLEVRSQTSSFAFKGKPQNVRDEGKQLPPRR